MTSTLVANVLTAGFIALILVALERERRVARDARRNPPESAGAGAGADVLGTSSSTRRRRRLLGLLWLSGAVAVVALEPLVARAFPSPWLRLAWFTLAFVFVLFAGILALREMADVSRRAVEQTTESLTASVLAMQLQMEIAKAREEAEAKKKGAGDAAAAPDAAGGEKRPPGQGGAKSG